MENTTTIRMVNVISNFRGTLGITLPELSFKRTWTKIGQKKGIPFNIMIEAIYDPGVEYMLNQGMIIIENLQDRIDLGLEEQGATESSILTLTENQILALLKIDSPEKLEETLQQLSKEQRKNVAAVMIENKILDLKRGEIVKKYTDIDVIKNIQLAVDNERN